MLPRERIGQEMTVAIVIDDEWEIARCLPWSAIFARGTDEPLVVVLLRDGKHEFELKDFSRDRQKSADDTLAVAALQFVEQDPQMVLAMSDEDPSDSKAVLEVPASDVGQPGIASDDSATPDSAVASSPAETTPQEEIQQADIQQVEATQQDEAQQEEPEVPEADSPLSVRVVELCGRDKASALLRFTSKLKATLLILPRHASERGLDDELPWEHWAYRRASCATLLLRPELPSGPGADEGDRFGDGEIGSVLAAVEDSGPSMSSLRWTNAACERLSLPLTALYVEPDVGELARAVGKRIAGRIVRRALGADHNVKADIVVGETVRSAILDYAQEREFGLVVLSANRNGMGRRWLRSSVSEWLMAQQFGSTVAILRPPIPFAHRLTTQCGDWLARQIPQLDRESRVSLFERVQQSSRWDFDFIALICLSTIIATLGLIQDSGAVVIGAMLVAPLMTPIVGAGLALVQGNRVLIRGAWATVLRGVLLAFIIGLGIGWCVPGLTESHEMLARGSPNILDLIVALIGGVAASYALGRPNLFSALPGVAIAAALVPPVATAGLGVSLGNLPLAFGALLLFVTNIVAIVIGTAVSLLAVGIRPTHEHGIVESWVYRIAAVLLVIVSLIAAFDFVQHPALPDSVEREIQTVLSAEPEVHLDEAKLASSRRVLLLIHSSEALAPTLRSKVAAVIRKQLGDDIVIQIETRLVTIDSQ